MRSVPREVFHAIGDVHGEASRFRNGSSNKEIAELLESTTETVRWLLRQILEKSTVARIRH